MDIQYTMPRIATATVVCVGESVEFTDELLHGVFFDITKILNYDTIQINLIFTDGHEPEIVRLGSIGALYSAVFDA